MAIDRRKWMDADEVRQLRTVTEAKSIVDLRAGRVNGPLAWMLVDTALSTGLRVSEIAALSVEGVNLKRGCLSVRRAKKRRQNGPESLAIGKELVDTGRPPTSLSGMEIGTNQQHGEQTPQGPCRNKGTAVRRVAGLVVEAGIAEDLAVGNPPGWAAGRIEHP